MSEPVECNLILRRIESTRSPVMRSILRRRAAALSRILAIIEEEFGDIGDCIMNIEEPEIPIGKLMAWPGRYRDLWLAPWEVFQIFDFFVEAYHDEVLAEAETP